MEITEIPCVLMSDCEKQFAKNIMIKANAVLKKWVVYYPPKYFRKLRNQIISGDKNPQGLIPCEKLPEFHSDIPHVLAVKKVHPELNNRTVIDAMLQQFSAMAKKHVLMWSNNSPDFLQDAYMAIIEAVYHYNRPEIELSTFVWSTIRNQMVTIFNRQNPFCPMTNSDLKLVVQYEKAKNESNGGSFEEIAKSIGLVGDDARYLESILTKVVSENQITDDSGRQNFNDYTGLREGIHSELSETEFHAQNDGVERILNSSGLTRMEREIIIAAMDPYPGWQTEFAKNHVNPKTNVPYTRMRITQILKKAREKVQLAMDEKKVA